MTDAPPLRLATDDRGITYCAIEDVLAWLRWVEEQHALDSRVAAELYVGSLGDALRDYWLSAAEDSPDV